STSEQGRSGLGLKVQESDIKEFCKNEGIELIKILSEVESGKGFDALAG
ncbi:resolvase, partial [Methylococcaceae bacterium CS3]